MRRSPLRWFVPAALCLVLAVVLLACGALLQKIASGVHDDFFTADTGSITIDGNAAVAADVRKVTKNSGQLAFLQTIEFRVRASPASTFVGVAPAADVERYLTGVHYQKIDKFEIDANEPLGYQTTPVAGSARPASPRTQTFWLAESVLQGDTQTLRWSVPDDGPYSVVIMADDGRPNPVVNVGVGIHLPWIGGALIGTFAAGGVVLGVAILCFVMGMRRRRPTAAGPEPPVSTDPNALLARFNEGREIEVLTDETTAHLVGPRSG